MNEKFSSLPFSLTFWIRSHRYFELLNGSLLIIDANTVTDNKRFKCTAINGYSFKPRRYFSPFLHVRPSIGDTIDMATQRQPKLLPRLQNQTVTIGSGQTLRLHCATASHAKTSSIVWHFASRSTPSASVQLESLNRIELKIGNVTPEANDGIYNCSYAGEFQVSLLLNYHHISLSLSISPEFSIFSVA